MLLTRHWPLWFQIPTRYWPLYCGLTMLTSKVAHIVNKSLILIFTAQLFVLLAERITVIGNEIKL